MAYKTLPKDQLSKTIRKWMKKFEIVAPQNTKTGLEYQVVSKADDIVLNHWENTAYPPKSMLLPQSETLFRCQAGRYEMPEMEAKKRILFGLRPCDARALWLLDKVFMEKDAEDIYWQKRREQTIVISMGCDSPCSSCFCTSVGGHPFGKEGADVQITEMDESYVFEGLTKAGNGLIAALPDADAALSKEVKRVQSESAEKMELQFEKEGLHEHLYALFEDKFWQEVSQSCLGCGVCTYLCPTCFCFDIVDEVQRGERVRNWDTCMFRIYSQEASGHNPRPTKAERTRQRVMHKFAYWVDTVNEIGCTGCGRCVVNCPVNLDIRQIVRGAQKRKVKVKAAK